MSPTLLATKLYIPPAPPRLVSRPRLTARLRDGMRRRCTLVSAPAGFGKTTLLSEWIHESEQAVAWVSLDESDNDPTHFLSYLFMAFQTIQPSVGQAAQTMLQSAQPLPVEFILTTWINEFAAATQDPSASAGTASSPATPDLALVLDDYHVIQSQPIHTALAFLIDHIPPPIHLVISSRADPPIPLARLRARGQLNEIRAADLRFTPDEAAAFLNRVMDLGLSAEEVAALEARTEGWIAGLQMAALSMRGQEDLAGFIRAFTGSHRYVLDYLVEEVFQRQSEHIQTFLLQTSILDRFTAPLCDALTGRKDSAQTLEELERANLFIISLDDERQWYRYHRLFADLLYHRLQQANRQFIPELHRRAAVWFENQGNIAEAFKHLTAAQDIDHAARLAEANGMTLLNRGEITQLLGWIKQIPEDEMSRHPWLRIYEAWAMLLTGQIGEIESRLEAAEHARSVAGAGDESDVRSQQGHSAAIRAYIAALSGDAPRTIRLAEEARTHLPPEAASVQSTVAFILGGANILAEDLAGAEAAFADAARLGEAARNIHVAIPALCALADLQATRGELHRAFGILQDALQLATNESGQTLPAGSGTFLGIGNLLFEWNDLSGAAQHLEKSVELSKLWGNVDSRVASHISLSRLRRTQGDWDGANNLLEEAGRIAQRSKLTPPMQALLVASQMRAWLAKGDLESAARLAQERGLSAEGKPTFASELAYSAFARVLLARGDFEAALRLLEQLCQKAEAAGRKRRVIEHLIIQSLAFEARGDVAESMAALERALVLAEPEGYVRTFLDEGASMLMLLRRAGSRGVMPTYVAKLLSPAAEPADAMRPTAQPLIDPLSERELQVLHLIAAGLSNPEIAEKLVVAVGTIKTHTSSIYRKLNVETRTQAVARARDLKLI